VEIVHLNRTATAGALSASIAHELNQPLAAIQSNTDAAKVLLKQSPLDLDEIKETLVDIGQANQRAAEIIRHLRTLLKRREIERREFDLNDAIASTLHILRPEATERNIVLSANGIERALPVRADKVLLEQVLMNLTVNGMDATTGAPQRARSVTIQTALKVASEVEVSVADSGTGIPTDKLEGIFATFYTTKRHGTGLGLSIARTIVEAYGGKIWAENQSTGGAVFRFTLPLAQHRPA